MQIPGTPNVGTRFENIKSRVSKSVYASKVAKEFESNVNNRR